MLPLVCAEEDPQLLDAVKDYLSQLEAGRCPSHRAFLARYPAIALTLADYLDALDLVHRGARVLTPRTFVSKGRD